jgi:hypothetical protein
MARFRGLLKVLSARWKLLAFMCLLFFCSVFTVASASEFLLPFKPYLGLSGSFPVALFLDNLPLAVMSIFLFNLVVSAFLVISVPGFLFFPSSSGLIFFRGLLWGLLLYSQRTWVVLVVMPTLVLEGTGYALASVAGTIVGASWLKTKWVYGQENLTRSEALEKALKECLTLYVFVAMILFIAAAIETATLAMITH